VPTVIADPRDLVFEGGRLMVGGAAIDLVYRRVLINDMVNFLIIAFVIFLVIKAVNRLKAAPPPPPNTKDCPRCLTAIPLGASRCSACCADLPATA